MSGSVPETGALERSESEIVVGAGVFHVSLGGVGVFAGCSLCTRRGRVCSRAGCWPEIEREGNNEQASRAAVELRARELRISGSLVAAGDLGRVAALV